MVDLLSNAISQAPGDADVICTTPSVLVLPPSYPPNFRVLMDSYHYLNLIRGPWQQADVDGDGTQVSSFGAIYIFVHNSTSYSGLAVVKLAGNRCFLAIVQRPHHHDRIIGLFFNTYVEL